MTLTLAAPPAILPGGSDAPVEPGRTSLVHEEPAIDTPDFMKQLTTFRVDGDDSGGLFLDKLWDLYKGHAVAAVGAG